MKFRRRITLQLTPLLDLLLIVIFAQYMDVREREATNIGETERLRQQSAATSDELTDLRQRHQRLSDDLTAARSTLALAEAQIEHLQAQSAQSQSDLDRAIAQQRVLGELVTELFNVPAEVVEQALHAPPGEQLRSRFREMSMQRSGEMIRHLLSYDELRKRIDLWELHIDDTGWITLTAGKVTRAFRAPSPDEFEQKMYEAYKSLPQTKSLVVILLSYGDARADIREAALKSLPRVTDRMREDSLGRARFEYAVLGFQPDATE